jgi:heme-degrading monooxygenase HmoA
MYFHISIHYPKAGKENLLIESMHRFGKAMEGKKGFIMAHTTKAEEKNHLIGIAIWESKHDWLAARPAMIEAVKNDSFEDWEEKPPEVFHSYPI